MSIREPCAGYFTDVYLKDCPCLKELLIYYCTQGNGEQKELLSTGAGLSQIPSVTRYIKTQSIIIKSNTGDLR